MDNRVTDCHQELKRLIDLQYESDFNDKFQESEFFRRKAEHIQNLYTLVDEVLNMFCFSSKELRLLKFVIEVRFIL